jgi:ubiquinone/menaquinone biosynthesis C-methylase UbiE
MEPRVARFCEAALRRVKPGARVLDYGCGTGHVARALADLGFQVTGADISQEMLEAARKERAGAAVSWVALDPGPEQMLPFAARSFGMIVSSSVLEYVAEPQRTLAEFKRVLAPGGWLLTTVPDPAHRSRRLEELVRRGLHIPGIESILRRTPLQAYVRYLGLSANRLPLRVWRQLFEASGFSVEAMQDGSALAMLEALQAESATTAAAP